MYDFSFLFRVNLAIKMLIKEDIKDEAEIPMVGVQEVFRYVSKSSISTDVLQLSQEIQYQDVTIICDGGKCQTNSFLLASIFPILKDIMEPSLEEKFISMPDISHKKLSEFFSNIHRKVFIPKNV